MSLVPLSQAEMAEPKRMAMGRAIRALATALVKKSAA